MKKKEKKKSRWALLHAGEQTQVWFCNSGEVVKWEGNEVQLGSVVGVPTSFFISLLFCLVLFCFAMLVGECEISSSVLGIESLKCLLDIQVERWCWQYNEEKVRDRELIYLLLGKRWYLNFGQMKSTRSEYHGEGKFEEWLPGHLNMCRLGKWR